MQPDPVDSTKMFSVDDHGWDEQDQYESDKYKKLELLRKEERLDIHDDLEQICSQELERLRLRQQAFLEYMGKEQGLDYFQVSVEIEIGIKEAYERHMRRRWADYFQVSVGMLGIQPLPEDQPVSSRQIESLGRKSLQHCEHEVSCIELCSLEKVDNHEIESFSSVTKFLPGVDTSNFSSSIYVPKAVRIFADDHGWDEKYQYESEEYEDSLKRVLKQGLEPPEESIFCSLELQKRVAKGRHDRQLIKGKLLENLKHNIVINMYLEWHMCGRWSHFRKYPVQPLGMQGLQPLPDNHAYLRFQNKMVDFERFPCDGTFPLVIGLNTYFSCTWIQTPKYLRKGSCIPFYTSTNKTTSGTIPATPGPGDKGFVLHSANNKPKHLRKNIFMLCRASNGGSSSEGTGFTLTAGNNHHREPDSPSNDMPEVILDSEAQANCTGDFNALNSNLSMGRNNVVLVAANGQEMETYISGSVCQERFEFHNVHYCPDLAGNRILVSGSLLDTEDYYCGFGRRKCSVTDLRTGRIVGEGRLVNGSYVMDYLKIPRDRTPGLVTRMWNAVSSALHRLGLNPQGMPM